jgi:hypothetical protein
LDSLLLKKKSYLLGEVEGKPLPPVLSEEAVKDRKVAANERIASKIRSRANCTYCLIKGQCSRVSNR